MGLINYKGTIIASSRNEAENYLSHFIRLLRPY